MHTNMWFQYSPSFLIRDVKKYRRLFKGIINQENTFYGLIILFIIRRNAGMKCLNFWFETFRREINSGLIIIIYLTRLLCVQVLIVLVFLGWRFVLYCRFPMHNHLPITEASVLLVSVYICLFSFFCCFSFSCSLMILERK